MKRMYHVPMVKHVIFSFFFCFLFGSQLSAKPVKVEQVRKIADTFLEAQNIRQGKRLEALKKERAQGALPQKFTVVNVREIHGDKGEILAYVIELNPQGFIVTAADSDIRPILCYSLQGKFPFEDSKQNVLLHLVKRDIKAHQKILGAVKKETQSIVQSNNNLWSEYVSSSESLLDPLPSPTQWPDKYWCPSCGHRQTDSGLCANCGQTVQQKDGWIVTNWDQGLAYNGDPGNPLDPNAENKFCPLDPARQGMRAVVGCTATAAAQITNYWKYPPAMRFTSDDRYIWLGLWGYTIIDDSSIQYNYPSFSELNSALSNIKYDGGWNEIAYLSFAIGIKHHMQYSSDNSGAPLSATAYKDGLQYGSAIGDWNPFKNWADYKPKVIENIQKGWPVQIGILEPSIIPHSHSVIVDGYKTTGEFHVNCGLDTNYNVWYFVPDIDVGGHHFTIVNAIVYDICPYKGWHQYGADQANTFRTPYNAPTTNHPVDKWEQECPGGYCFKGLVVGAGNKIFAACSLQRTDEPGNRSLWVIDQYGTKQNEIMLTTSNNLNQDVTYPVQDSKGNIFVGTGPQIYKIDPQTYTKSLIFTEPWGEYFSCLKIDEVGYIYASTVSKLYCLDGSGNRLWPQPFLLTQNQFFIEGIPAIDTIRNRVYTTYSDCETNQSYLASINRQTGLLVETRPDCAGVPSIGADGTIYVGGKSSLYALNPYYMGGSPLWTKPLGSSTVAFNTPVIGYDGTLYFSYKANISGSWHIKCEALAPSDGSTNWQEDLTANMYDNISQPYVSGNKVVVFTIKRHIGEGQYRFEIYAYRDASDHAEPLWTKNYNYSAGNLAFGPGATLYFWGQTGADREIYAISEGAKGDPEGAAMGWCNNTAPTIPSNPSPTNGANNIGPVATLSWDCTDANDLRYTVFLNQLDSGGVISSIATIENQTSYQLEGLKPSTAYAWKITATDGQAVTEGPTWVFSTKLPNPDLSGDDFVNFEDFAILASHWMETCSDPDYCQGADYYHDGQVDSKDLYYISENWLRYVPPDMVWVYINDPGVSSHEGFTGEISKYETTNAQYCLFLNVALASGDITVSGSTVYGANGSNSGADFVGQAYYNLAGSGLTYNGATNGGAARIHYSGSVFTVDSGFENHPITYVSWYGATAFCNYYGYRLPTQWEWQAVADYDGSFTYGCGTSINNGIANYLGSTHPDGTTVVGAFGMYGYGMCDMAGNVWEWTSSINSSGVCYVRGGSWHDPDEICSVSIWYYGGYPDGMNCLYGFRVCRNVEPSGMVWVYINDPGVSGHEGFTGYMSKYETTNAQYCQFLNAAKASNQITVYNNFVFATSDTSRSQPYYYLAGMGSNYGGATNGGAARIHYSSGVFSVDSGFENHPVSYVSWYGATAFCNYYGYRLPTEWEWQAVADYDGSYTYGCGTTINNSIANYVDSIHPDGTTIVGAFGTYGYGTCNMAGNVWEWTSSIYNGDHRVIRGGGWVDNGIDCTVSSRFHYSQQFMYISVGFRACR